MIPRDYLVFWLSDTKSNGATVVRIDHPPHEAPAGKVLDDLVLDAVRGHNPKVEGVRVVGVCELAPAHWSRGAQRAVSLGDGRVAALECGGNGWALHL